jgi:multicomponent Na+:H+ antiporter subunit D
LGELIRQTEEPRRLILPFALIMTAVTVKAALFPLFSWLPKAHGTPGSPTVVSALLSGLSVKMGLYLFIRVTALFAPQINLTRFYLAVGFLTGLVAVILAMRQTDIKRILAYSTISQIGLILIGLSYGTPRAFWGAIYHLINHALFKSALFLVAGLIVEIWGSRNIRKISYVYRHVPFISIAALLAILGITGAPLFNGSISKYLIGSDLDGTIFEYGLVLLNLGTMVVFVRFASLFFGKPAGAGQVVPPGHLVIPLSRRIVVGLLGLVCFVGGLFGSTFVSTLFGLDVRISLDDFGIKFLIYLITLAGGILINHLLRKPLANLPSCARHEPGFNRMSLAMVTNFAVLAGYLALTLPA